MHIKKDTYTSRKISAKEQKVKLISTKIWNT